MTTIIFAHPSHDSFNYAEVKAIEAKLAADGQPYRLIDLYVDGFNPVLSDAEITQQKHSLTDDPTVMAYQKALASSTMVIFVFPVWWGEMPAIMKGFFDRVMTPGFAYSRSSDGAVLPGLQIQRTMIITTSGAESVIFGPYIEGYFIPFTLATIGMNGAEWYNCGNVHRITREAHQQFIDNIISKL